MNKKDKIKLFQDVFAPKKDERIIILMDTYHDNIMDNKKWKERREMAHEWFEILQDMGNRLDFSTEILEYPATGIHNTPLPDYVVDKIKDYNLFIAMTEYSASSTLIQVTHSNQSHIRGASMPLVEKRMEKTAFTADYKIVQDYAASLKKMLNDAIGAKILFSTNETLFIDLRYRLALSEAGDCTKPGQCINFPSGEACIAPYEAVPEENIIYGESKSEGIWPVSYNGSILKYKIKNNSIFEVIGEGKKSDDMRNFFDEDYSHRNIAELGIGCNPKAIVTGNPLEDEKVGLHIAYGMSAHLGGKVQSNTHIDIIHAKGCPIEGRSLTLYYKDGTSIELIQNSKLRYSLLK
jgi:leucyl aminopeptidase (aminopeptidase T)